jgi:hypothetical protein
MKRILAFLLAVGHKLYPAHEIFHDETLRANQGDRAPTFSFWRALVS